MRATARWVAEHGADQADEPEEAEHIREMGRMLASRAGELESAAHGGDVHEVAERLGALQSGCAGCHAHTRWEHGDGEEGAEGPHVAEAPSRR